ncbi:hypothetical protein PPYR_12206 [Photinus pyralis]|uniref:PR domain zinc finger protein 10 n=1 Tax=Photinus pyralis TaxID=7054 RepID=A0A5N4ADF7_PHOPY|nr:PR domain zinc finger protein 10-like [Photinus pyralis]KAB0795367.1 hypothetical protein PPYR_12206 [Photinus pyralis]
MESTLESPAECNNTLSIANFNTNPWTSTPNGTNRNQTYLFIAVEYVKDTDEYKISTEDFATRTTTTITDFQDHVSPLDPNMSSAACYSPSANDPDIAYNNSVVVPQLITSNTNQPLLNASRDSFINQLVEPNAPLEHIPNLTNSETNLLKEVVSNRYLLNQEPTTNPPNPGVLQLVSDRNPEQEVELLITDQTTGISYNVSTQEYLVERCLADEQHLLDALAPDPLLDPDLLTLDVSTLKSQLPDIVEAAELISNSVIQQNLTDLEIKTEDFEEKENENLRRSLRQHDLKLNEKEEGILLNKIRTISDKPVESRAKATLPAHYLAIIKNDKGGYGVFAQKLIPKQTQFGPLEGLVVVNDCQPDSEGFHLLVESDNGTVHRLDVSDDRVANWMCYVRRAETYMEQNVVVVQRGSSLFYNTVTNILPKQELLVGYSSEYAKKHSLPLLQPIAWKENDWPCFECDKQFASSIELQAHLDKHDEVKRDLAPKAKKKIFKSKRKKFKKKFHKQVLQCNSCKEVFMNPKFVVLKKHLLTHGLESRFDFEEKFTVVNCHCLKCDTFCESFSLLKAYSLQHRINSDNNRSICVECNKEFPSKEELNKHSCESVEKSPTSKNGCKCPVCYKVFASQERIQRHMLVHGSEESKPLKCDTCNKRFLNNSALACHLKTHSVGKRMFECPMCNESFQHVLQLKVHVPLHCIDGKYTCPHCKKIFKEYSIIRKHIRAFHCERKHNCPQCNKPFPTLDKLRMHLLRHSDHREFLCADCGKQFKRKDKLKEHTKRMHSEERENTVPKASKLAIQNSKRFTPKVQPTDYHRFIYKCHACLVGFKRRGMLVNHLAKRHPDISPDSVPELNLPILRTTRDYYCQYCDKIYKSSSKRKAHILKNHPGQALPMSNRRQGSFPEVAGLPNPTFSQTVGSITTHPQACQWCHKQYASKAKLLQHQRKKHSELLESRNPADGSLNDQNVREDQLGIDQQAFHREVSDEDLLAEVVSLNNNRDDDQYYHIISLPSSGGAIFNHAADSNHTSDSRLYRLLTTGNGHLPPR